MKLTRAQITIDNLLDALSRGRQAIKEAAEIMVALVDQDPGVYKKITEKDPRLSLNLLVTLEKVGRGVIYDALLFDTSPGARRLLSLPYSKQKEYYEAPIKVVEIKDNKAVVVEKPIQQLPPKQVAQVFTDTGIRPPAEQVKILEAAARPLPAPATRAQRYEILPDGSLFVLAQTTFTPSQLQDIYERVTQKAIKSLKR